MEIEVKGLITITGDEINNLIKDYFKKEKGIEIESIDFEFHESQEEIISADLIVATKDIDQLLKLNNKGDKPIKKTK